VPENKPKIWKLRPAKDTDRAFIIDSWLRSHRGRWLEGKKPPRALDYFLLGEGYYRGHNRLVNALCDDATLTVAGYDEDEDFILGWSATSPQSVHYVWVRAKFRRKGIAKDLLQSFLDIPAIYTHPPASTSVQVPLNWIYDPLHVMEVIGAPVRRRELGAPVESPP
jgi:GNAT superfamily N-acetyltransferase